MNNFNQGLTSLSITWFDESNNMEVIDFYELDKTQKLYQPFSNIIYYKELNPVDLGKLKDKINLTDEQFNNVLGIEQYTNNNIISVNNIYDEQPTHFLKVVEFILNNMDIKEQKYIFRNYAEISLYFCSIKIAFKNERLALTWHKNNVYHLEYVNNKDEFKTYIMINQFIYKKIDENEQITNEHILIYEPIGSLIVNTILNQSSFKLDLMVANNEKNTMETVYKNKISDLTQQIIQLENSTKNIRSLDNMQNELITKLNDMFDLIKNKYEKQYKEYEEEFKKQKEEMRHKYDIIMQDTQVDTTDLNELNQQELIMQNRHLLTLTTEKDIIIQQKDKKNKKLMDENDEIRKKLNNQMTQNEIVLTKLSSIIPLKNKNMDDVINELQNGTIKNVELYKNIVSELMKLIDTLLIRLKAPDNTITIKNQLSTMIDTFNYDSLKTIIDNIDNLSKCINDIIISINNNITELQYQIKDQNNIISIKNNIIKEQINSNMKIITQIRLVHTEIVKLSKEFKTNNYYVDFNELKITINKLISYFSNIEQLINNMNVILKSEDKENILYDSHVFSKDDYLNILDTNNNSEEFNSDLDSIDSISQINIGTYTNSVNNPQTENNDIVTIAQNTNNTINKPSQQPETKNKPTIFGKLHGIIKTDYSGKHK